MRIADTTDGLVTFDGDLCAGKATLARKVSSALGLPVLDLDSFW
jgi:tRNA A37 threonylcarbamoyladenosine biosynthesis protein TsaE